MRVALVHDWLVADRGGERVLAALAERFADAPIYTLVVDPEATAPALRRHPLRTSFLQRLPGAPGSFRRYLPLMPAAAESWDFSGFDLVISTSHCVAKGVRAGRRLGADERGPRHLAYVHSPMRYVWDQLPSYLPPLAGRWGGVWRPLLLSAARLAATPLRVWDRKSAQRPDTLLANSVFVAERIRRYWGRDAGVVHPPVSMDDLLSLAQGERRGYLVVGALVPYKRIDVAVRAAVLGGLDLTVVGEGPERHRLERLGAGRVRFFGSAGRSELVELYRGARALLNPGVEDFGMAMVEAQAAGCPVIALAAGGALEIVDQRHGGAFFDACEPEALLAAIVRFERGGGAEAVDVEGLRQSQARFTPERFTAQIDRALGRLLDP